MFSTQENTIPHAPARFPISERGGDVHSRTKERSGNHAIHINGQNTRQMQETMDSSFKLQEK
jgi:hypothetical protein